MQGRLERFRIHLHAISVTTRMSHGHWIGIGLATLLPKLVHDLRLLGHVGLAGMFAHPGVARRRILCNKIPHVLHELPVAHRFVFAAGHGSSVDAFNMTQGLKSCIRSRSHCSLFGAVWSSH